MGGAVKTGVLNSSKHQSFDMTHRDHSSFFHGTGSSKKTETSFFSMVKLSGSLFFCLGFCSAY